METKQEFRYFTITEYDKEQQYLSRRHKEGWKFTEVTGIGQYHFEKCEPEEVVYQLDYNQEGNINQAEYTQMFEDCGWEYITTYVGYSYFRKPVADMKEEEEIFFDDSSKLDMMQRIFKGRMIPMFIVFFLYLAWQFLILHFFEGTFFTVVATILRVMMVVYITVTIHFGIKYVGHLRKIKK